VDWKGHGRAEMGTLPVTNGLRVMALGLNTAISLNQSAGTGIGASKGSMGCATPERELAALVAAR
jgi:hypothetical protein